MELEVPDERLKAVLNAVVDSAGSDYIECECIDAEFFKHKIRDDKYEAGIVLAALKHPISSPTLSELAKGKQKITIITSDHTRPMPSRVTMPLILEEIRKGAPGAEILILVATGLHRATNDDELLERFGEDICRNEKIIVHDCRDESSLIKIGTLPSGRALVLSKYAIDTDLLVSEGFIEPHFFAGFSGGRKSVLPGVAGYECVVANHSSDFIADENATAGVLICNPVHEDMVAAAKIANLAFILNVTLGENQKINGAVAGDPFLAHNEGCALSVKKVAVERVLAPIVITTNGGYPLDQNLYQMVKGMDTAEKCCEKGGVIIAVGECRDGAGGDVFFEDFASGKSPGELTKEFLSRKACDTAADQWQSQILARILEKFHVIVVAPLIEDIVKQMGMGWAADLNEAIALADEWLEKSNGSEADIVVIPNGPGVFVI